MSHLTESLLGWLTIMGMVFGGVGVLFFVMFAIRSLALLVRRVRIAPPEVADIRGEVAPVESHRSRTR